MKNDIFNTSHRVERLTNSKYESVCYRKAMGVVAALALLASPGCSDDQKVPKERIAAVDSYKVETNDVTLNVETQGNPNAKEVTIAIHGGPGLSLDSLTDLTPLASEDRLLVRYDQRGSGASSAPSSGDFSVQSQLEDIEAIRMSTGADKVDLIGRSWGGLLAAAYAAQNPDKVDDVVLISAIPLDIKEFLAGQKRFGNRIEELQGTGVIPNPLPEIDNNSCENRLDAVLPAYMSDPNGLLPEGVGSCTADTSQRTYEAILQPRTLEPYAAQAKNYTGDVLVLAGDDDPFGVQWPQKIDEVLGRGALKTVIFKNTGHFVTFERPRESLQLINEFLG